MRGRHCDRVAAPSAPARGTIVRSRWNQSTSMPAMPASASRLRNAGCDRAEVFADHHRAMAMRLERDQPQQVFDRIGEIGALARRTHLAERATAAQAHRVIDAHAAGMRMAARKVAMNGSKPLAISACGEKPVRPQSWPRALNRSGGAPTFRPSSRSLLSRPGMAAARIHPDRKIGDQPDAHAARRAHSCCTCAKLRAASHCRNRWNRIALALGSRAKRRPPRRSVRANRPASRRSSISARAAPNQC